MKEKTSGSGCRERIKHVIKEDAVVGEEGAGWREAETIMSRGGMETGCIFDQRLCAC